jgi:hypothetical protein
MYLLPIHVPIYTHGTERLLATDWKRSLLLLRDSLQGRYGRVRVIAPTLPAAGAQAEQLLEPVHASDEIELVPSFSWDTRAREFWAKHVHTWRADIAAALPETDVVHTGFCDVYRPLVFLGFLAALRARKPTVFVQDTDQVLQHSHLSAGAPLKKRAQVRAYNEIFERSVRYGVARASLSLLKGRALHKRYGQYAANAKNFHDTSYFSQEIVARDKIEHRIATLLSEPRPLRVCYCGRLEARKGLAHSIEAVAAASTSSVMASSAKPCRLRSSDSASGKMCDFSEVATTVRSCWLSLPATMRCSLRRWPKTRRG